MTKIVTLMLNPSVDVMLEFDEFIKTKTNRVKNKTTNMGGKGLNVSFVAKSFGLQVCATGFIGADRQSELSKLLKEADIENAFVTVDGETRTNLKLLDCAEGSVTEANGQGFSVSEAELSKLEAALIRALKGAQILVLTGSLPSGIDSGFYARCIEEANKMGVKTVLDASGEALKKALAQKPYAIKPNIDELSELKGKTLVTDAEIGNVIKELLESGIGIVTVSMGADGALFANSEKLLRAKAFEVDFKSAVGAGDSMVGAICYSIANGEPLERTARLGISAGCVTTSKTGTFLCTADEVFENESRVKTMELEI